MNKQILYAILITLCLMITTQSSAQDIDRKQLAQDIFNKYAEAIGGKEVFAKITGRIYKGSLEAAQMNLNGTFEMFYKFPNKNLVSLNITGMGENLNGFDGTTAWAKNSVQGLRIKSGAELEQVKLTSDFYYLVNLAKIYPNAESIGTEKINNMDTFIVKADENTTFYFDKQSGLLLKNNRTTITSQGKMSTTILFEDYREIEGIKYPFIWRQSIHGSEMILRITEIKHNPVMDETIFSKPK